MKMPAEWCTGTTRSSEPHLEWHKAGLYWQASVTRIWNTFKAHWLYLTLFMSGSRQQEAFVTFSPWQSDTWSCIHAKGAILTHIRIYITKIQSEFTITRQNSRFEFKTRKKGQKWRQGHHAQEQVMVKECTALCREFSRAHMYVGFTWWNFVFRI